MKSSVSTARGSLIWPDRSPARNVASAAGSAGLSCGKRRPVSVNLAWAVFGLVMLAGVAVASQSGVNATLARGVGGPVQAAFLSFAVGTVALLLVVLARRDAWPDAAALGALPWWAWVGGLLGAFYVTVAVLAAPKLGAGALVAGVIAGQLLAVVVIDHFGWLGFPQRLLTLPRMVGVVLLGAGALLVRLR